MAGEDREVLLHVYDLSQGMAKQMSMAMIGKQIDGIWHTGVVLGGQEYFFGGGIQVSPAGKTVHGVPVETIKLGTTMVPDELLMEFLEEISPRFTQETYSLLHNNCNNFSNELSTFLTGQCIPERITGLPAEFLNTPVGQMLMPMLAPMEAQLRQTQGQHQPFSARHAAPATPVPGPATTSATPAAPSKLAGEAAAVSRAAEGTPVTSYQQPATPASSSAPKQPGKAEFEAFVKEEFGKLMASGEISPNEAAAKAVKLAAARVKCQA